MFYKYLVNILEISQMWNNKFRIFNFAIQKKLIMKRINIGAPALKWIISFQKRYTGLPYKYFSISKEIHWPPL